MTISWQLSRAVNCHIVAYRWLPSFLKKSFIPIITCRYQVLKWTPCWLVKSRLEKKKCQTTTLDSDNMVMSAFRHQWFMSV